MIEFANDKILTALLLIPVLLLLFFLYRRNRKRYLRKYADELKHLTLIPWVSPGKPWFKQILFLVANFLLIVGLSGPRVGSKLREVEKKGREIIIALDVSNSMLATDVNPNRLEMAKTAISLLFNKLVDDRIGLIVFAGDAYTQIPLTNDYSVARAFLASAGPGSVSKQGTSIAAAIKLSLRSFSPEFVEGASAKSKAIIIITDGEDHEEGAVEAAEEAKKLGVVIHTIGIGDPNGVPIPLSSGTSNFRKDKEGKVIVSKLDEKTLTNISDLTGGYYIRAGKDASGLFRLISRLDELDKKEFKVKMFEEYEERFQYFIGFALLILIFEFFISDTRNRWLTSLKIFGSQKAEYRRQNTED